MPSIEEEIKQERFNSPLHRAQVNILYTAAWLNQRTVTALRPLKLSVQQFNILRILRGRKGEPATVKLLTERMLDKMSNASRLVDKLCEKGYTERRQCNNDRRRVDIVITEAGLRALEEAQVAVERAMEDDIGDISREELNRLSGLLDDLRG